MVSFSFCYVSVFSDTFFLHFIGSFQISSEAYLRSIARTTFTTHCDPSFEMSTVRYIYINIYEYKHDYEYED